MTSSESRLTRFEAFLRACNWRGDLGSDVLHAADLVCAALTLAGEFGLPDEDRKLLKLAAATVAYFREVKKIALGEVELDFREEEILKAVLETRGES